MDGNKNIKVKILKVFRDINNYSIIYEPEQEIEFEAQRAEKMVLLGLAKKTGEEDAIDEFDLKLHWQKVVEQVKNVSDVELLNNSLEIEQAGKTPRNSVIKAIEKRLAELHD